MKKQTAVEWLVAQLTYSTENNRFIDDGCDDVTDIVNEARQMFQSQINDAWADGFHYDLPFANTEDYYKETYGEQDSEQAD